ncbi:MAG TPA: hypothetical protein VKX28_26975 [Xanthobacteraceae bacterium]|nr:hypothetical protein [Xanthobacteraceae bacterium]
MGATYKGHRLKPAPWWLCLLQLLVLAPIAILMAICSALQATARGIEWATRGRGWVKPFERASDHIELWWHRRQCRRIDREGA